MKFKKGDLVEIVNHPNRVDLLGERFTLQVGEFRDYYLNATDREIRSGFVWDTPFPSIHLKGTTIVVSEDQIKKINPDTDETSSFTFEELLGKLKTDQLEGVE